MPSAPAVPTTPVRQISRLCLAAAAALALVAVGQPRLGGPAAVLAQDESTLADLQRLENTLTVGERADIQRALADLGFYDGPIDSDFGPGTREAIRRLQAAIGDIESGWLSADQLRVVLAGEAASLIGGGEDGAGDTRDAAAFLGMLEGSLTANDTVSLADREDFYGFLVLDTQPTTILLTMTAGDADLALLDSAGALVALSNRQDGAPERLEIELAPGDYTLQVSFFEGTSPYRLVVEPTAEVGTDIDDLIAWEAEWSRDERRRVERAFELLGYVSGGVDGYFGAQTRDAIRTFQVAGGDPASGYLTMAQRVRLAVEAADAAAAVGQEIAAAATSRAAAARSVADRAPPSGYDGYRGDIRNGDREGLGVFAWEDGNRYEGEFLDDRRHGLGVYFESDGDRYEGEFVDEDRRGFGAFAKPDGRVWRGEFRDGPFEGFGVFTNAEGFRVAGEWRRTSNGGWSFTGYGEQIPAGGEPQRGLWDASELVEPL